MAIKGLTVNETDDTERTTYLPVVATVTTHSQYNTAAEPDKDRFGLSGIDGWWLLSPRLREKMGTPPVGTKALWTLATKPKTGPKAKPGSMYEDVIAVEKVPADYVEPPRAVSEPASGMSSPPAGAITRNDQLPAEWTLPLSHYQAKEASIAKQVVLKAVAEVLVATIEKGGVKALLPDGQEVVEVYLWNRFVQLGEELAPKPSVPLPDDAEESADPTVEDPTGGAATDSKDADTPW